jgi:hypothetical protein
VLDLADGVVRNKMVDARGAKNAVLEVLRIGLLRIRAHADAGNAEACSIEADHLHNLPGILKADRCDELVDYYYKIERPAFLARVKSNADHFQAPWTDLAKAIGLAG